MEEYRITDPAIRPVEERDVPAIIGLFELNYGRTHPHPEVYDEGWVKRAVHGEDLCWLVLEEGGEVLASGSLELDYGDHDDQLGLIGRLVARREGASGSVGSWPGKRMINALAAAAEAEVECVVSHARTKHRGTQRYLQRAGLTPAGLLPHHTIIGGRRENLVLYAKLSAEGRGMRSERPPQVLPEAAPLARHVLSSAGLPEELEVVGDCPPYPDGPAFEAMPLDGSAAVRLRRMGSSRADPLVFDGVSLGHGARVLTRRGCRYLAAAGPDGVARGAVGYRIDEVNEVLKITELVCDEPGAVGPLCRAALAAALRRGVPLIEADLSAYDARVQRTFLDLGFRPAAYVPGMVFHGAGRLDVVKMVRLQVPYDPAETLLTPGAAAAVSLVEEGFREAPAEPAA